MRRRIGNLLAIAARQNAKECGALPPLVQRLKQPTTAIASTGDRTLGRGIGLPVIACCGALLARDHGHDDRVSLPQLTDFSDRTACTAAVPDEHDMFSYF